MNNSRLALYVLALSIAAPAIASAERGVPSAEQGAPRIRVAVIPGIAVNLDAARVDALSQDLADALATELDIEAIGGLEVRRLLPPDGIPPDCVATPACTQDVAQRTGAAQLLFVVMVDTGAGGAIQIDSTWVEPATGSTTSRPAIDVASISDARSRFVTAARQLLPDAPVRPKPKAGGGGGPIGTMSPEVPRHLTLPAKITAGAAVVGLGLGIGFGLRARSRYGDCDALPIACSPNERDGVRNLALIADLGYVVALGAGIATAVMYVTSGKESRLIVAPIEEGVSISAIGRF